MDKFFVGTVEGGGTHLLLWLLESHPMLKADRDLMDLRTIPPKDPPAPYDRLKWVSLEWLRREKFKKTILLTRTPVNAVFSAYRRFWTAKKGTKEEVAHLHLNRHYLSLWHMKEIRHMLPSLDIKYEDLTMDTEGELKKIAEFLDLRPTVWKYDISKTQHWFGFSGIRNRNNGKWKQDEHFQKVWELHGGTCNV